MAIHFGKGKVNPIKLKSILKMDAFYNHNFQVLKVGINLQMNHISNFANELGWIAKKEQIVLQIYSEEMQKFRLARRFWFK